jgi:hypothetical protein
MLEILVLCILACAWTLVKHRTQTMVALRTARNSAEHVLANFVDLPYEAVFILPMWKEFYYQAMDYVRTLYILCAMCTGYLLARVGMRHVTLPLYIVGVTCHAAYGWLILVSQQTAANCHDFLLSNTVPHTSSSCFQYAAHISSSSHQSVTPSLLFTVLQVHYPNYPTYYAYTFDAATWGGMVNFYILLFERASLLCIFRYAYAVIIQALWPSDHTFVARLCGFQDSQHFVVSKFDRQAMLDSLSRAEARATGDNDIETGVTTPPTA